MKSNTTLQSTLRSSEALQRRPTPNATPHFPAIQNNLIRTSSTPPVAATQGSLIEKNGDARPPRGSGGLDRGGPGGGGKTATMFLQMNKLHPLESSSSSSSSPANQVNLDSTSRRYIPNSTDPCGLPPSHAQRLHHLQEQRSLDEPGRSRFTRKSGVGGDTAKDTAAVPRRHSVTRSDTVSYLQVPGIAMVPRPGPPQKNLSPPSGRSAPQPSTPDLDGFAQNAHSDIVAPHPAPLSSAPPSSSAHCSVEIAPPFARTRHAPKVVYSHSEDRVKTSAAEVRPIVPSLPYSPYGSPASSPRLQRQPTRETRRLSITESEGWTQLNQYKLKDEIGKVCAIGCSYNVASSI